jgi:GNAT superfamily N-acetyltransferase
MSWENLCAQCSAIPLEPSQVDGLAMVLGQAYYDEPHIRYILRDEQSRIRLLPDFFRAAIHATQLNGGIHTTHHLEGAALWMGPGSKLTVAWTMRSALQSISHQFEWATLRRCVTLGLHLDQVHQQLINRRHLYLMALGVEPSVERESVRTALIEPVLARADAEGLPCYVETFNDKELPFYKRHGFRIAGSGKITGVGPDFWAMIRPSQIARKE